LVSNIIGCPIFTAALDPSDAASFYLVDFNTTLLLRAAFGTSDGPPGLPPLRSG